MESLNEIMGRQPWRPKEAHQARAWAEKAEPTAKGLITNALDMENGRFWDLTDGQFRLMSRLVGLLNKENCKAGDYKLTITNRALSHELGVTVRCIQLRLACLEDEGLIYRHFIGGEVGLDRAYIDLAPMVARVHELWDAVNARKRERQQYRDELKSPLAFPSPSQEDSSPHESSSTLNTQTSNDLICNAQQKSEAPAVTPPPPLRPAAPIGIPRKYEANAKTPAPSSPRAFANLIEQAAPEIAGGGSIIDSAYELARSWGVPQRVWGEGCLTHGREVVAAVVAVCASMSPDQFKKGRVAWTCKMLSLTPDQMNIWASLRKAAKKRAH